MYNTERIINRLPSHFQAYDEDSILHNFISAFGKSLEEAEKNIESLMINRWFPVAELEDLERLSMLFGIERLDSETYEHFRTRIESTRQELLEGMGTVASIRRFIQATTGITPEIVENPARAAASGARMLKPGDKWTEFCNSVVDSVPTINIRGITTTRDPTLTNLTTGESVTYQGLLRKGAVLTIYPDGKASLAGINVSDKIQIDSGKPPSLPKATSEWIYTDANAFLDYGKFDECALADESAYMVEVGMEWVEQEPAAFTVRLLRSTLKTDNENRLQKEIQGLVESVRTAGVVVNVEFCDVVDD